MRDKRTPKDVCGEATFYTDRLNFVRSRMYENKQNTIKITFFEKTSQ